MILAGDIGGTKTILALFQQKNGKWICYRKKKYLSADYESFNRLLNEFMLDDVEQEIEAVCIGVAGPVINGDCDATNLIWKITRAEISEIVGSDRVCLINDLEAAAQGILGLSDRDLVELNLDAQSLPGNIAVLAAGTGLGEAILYWDGLAYHAIASEGGHADFAPNNKQEDALLVFLRAKYKGHVSYERLISGEGILNIYQFLKNSGFAQETEATEQAIKINDPAAVIAEAALSGRDALCRETLQMFCRFYGAEAGNLALKCLPYSGVYLSGGIGPKIAACLKKDFFMQGFLNKGRYREILRKIPVRLCLDQDAALSGAADYAEKMIK